MYRRTCVRPSVNLAGNVYNWQGALQVRFNIIIRANEIRALATWYVIGAWYDNKALRRVRVTTVTVEQQ
jgi:hypothetical protein